MECNVCLEAFDAVERRPKSLPCGHTYCLSCLRRLKTRRCPVDNQVFKASPEHLPANYLVLQLTIKPAQPAGPRFWCLSCKTVAAASCVDDHAVRSLNKARAEDAAPLLKTLQQSKEGLTKLGEVLEAAARGLETQPCRAQLEKERAGLAAVKARLEDAMGADAAAWEAAKLSAAQEGLFLSAAQLAADLADPTAACSVSLRRGASGDVAWRGEVRPADDAAARLLLCQMACRGALQPQDEHGEQRPAAPRWQERPNELELTAVEEMAARMVVGSKVVRGRDWPRGSTSDGTPPGPGLVTQKDGSVVRVKWNQTGITAAYSMGYEGEYHVRLVASPALNPFLKTPEKVMDVSLMSSAADSSSMKVLTDSHLAQVRTVVGLHGDQSAPWWSLALLQQVAPHLQGLQMMSPQQRHLDAALAMPQLRELSLTNVTAEQLRQVAQMASLRRLELHCTFGAPLPVLTLPAKALLRLRCGVYPLAAALALVRANAETLEELQLVAASIEPYGCPDLAAELRRCGFKKLRRMVLLRETAFGDFCRHDRVSCTVQCDGLRTMFAASGLNVTMMCSECNRKRFRELCKP